MSQWINCDKSYPLSPWHVVFVTDGECTCLARWIEDPKYWYGPNLTEWDEDKEEEIPLDEEWHSSHWLFIREIGPFNGNDECFGFDGDNVSHWMPLPTPPEKDE